MKKILLIEDRFKRQEIFQEELEINLEEFNDILDNTTYERYEDVYEILKKEEFNFSPYSVAIVHKSAFGDENSTITAYIEQKCKELSIILIYFSGGIDANFYQKDGTFELFEVNSKTLYSANIALFLKAYRKNILKPGMLLYGEHWKINLLCNKLNKLNYYIEHLQDNAILEDFFYEDNSYLRNILFKMDDIKFYTPKPINEEISKDEMKKLRDNIQHCIEKELTYE